MWFLLQRCDFSWVPLHAPNPLLVWATCLAQKHDHMVMVSICVYVSMCQPKVGQPPKLMKIQAAITPCESFPWSRLSMEPNHQTLKGFHLPKCARHIIAPVEFEEQNITKQTDSKIFHTLSYSLIICRHSLHIRYSHILALQRTGRHVLHIKFRVGVQASKPRPECTTIWEACPHPRPMESGWSWPWLPWPLGILTFTNEVQSDNHLKKQKHTHTTHYHKIRHRNSE